MSQRPMVRVSHPDFEETALVPASALPRMTAQGWAEVTDEQPNEQAATADPPPDTTPTEPTETPASKAAKKPGQRATTTNKEH